MTRRNIITISAFVAIILVLWLGTRPLFADVRTRASINRELKDKIAQELEAIYPEMVNVNDEGILSVEYQQLISPMLAALLEMDARITALENQ